MQLIDSLVGAFKKVCFSAKQIKELENVGEELFDEGAQALLRGAKTAAGRYSGPGGIAFFAVLTIEAQEPLAVESSPTEKILPGPSSHPAPNYPLREDQPDVDAKKGLPKLTAKQIKGLTPLTEEDFYTTRAAYAQWSRATLDADAKARNIKIVGGMHKIDVAHAICLLEYGLK